MAEYIYGKNAVLQRIKEGNPILEVYITKGNQEIEQIMKQHQLKYRVVDKGFLNQLVTGVHQGVVAKIDGFKLYTLNEVISSVKTKENPLFVMLDGLEDPHNLGAILRNCDACGVDAVIIAKNRSAGINATVAKVAVGAVETVKVVEVVNLNQTIKQLKEQGFWIVGTDVAQSVDYRQAQYDMPLVLIIGSEGFGISRLVKKNCDFLVHLPMYGKINSLNASVACGVLLYEMCNQRFPLKER